MIYTWRQTFSAASYRKPALTLGHWQQETELFSILETQAGVQPLLWSSGLGYELHRGSWTWQMQFITQTQTNHMAVTARRTTTQTSSNCSNAERAGLFRSTGHTGADLWLQQAGHRHTHTIKHIHMSGIYGGAARTSREKETNNQQMTTRHKKTCLNKQNVTIQSSTMGIRCH